MADGTITMKLWRRYASLQFKIQTEAADLMRDYINQNGFADRDAAIAYAYGLATKYGEAAAAAACEMYDRSAELAGVTVPAAEPAETATLAETAESINGILKRSENTEMLSSAVGRLAKLAGADTTLKNARRDGAEWAWVPVGDTCAFCIMLASNGWQHQSTKALKGGHAQHIHANCDCQYAVRFGGKGGPAGYDEKTYERLYYGADLDHWNTPDGKPPAGHDRVKRPEWQERLDAMRREAYAENKAEINAQTRSAYAKRRELESSRAEEINVNGR